MIAACARHAAGALQPVLDAFSRYATHAMMLLLRDIFADTALTPHFAFIHIRRHILRRFRCRAVYAAATLMPPCRQ